MLNINESMWRDSATTTTMAKTPNAWGTSNDMAIPRRNQFSTANSNNVDPGSNPGPAINTNGVTGPASSGPPGVGPGGPGGPAGERLKFMFSADDMTESVLFGGPTQKIAGLEDAMDRLNMVIYKTILTVTSVYSYVFLYFHFFYECFLCPYMSFCLSLTFFLLYRETYPPLTFYGIMTQRAIMKLSK